MRMKMIAAGLLTLAALPASAQTGADPYVARGTAPVWTLTIDGRTIRFEAPGRAPVSVAAPKVVHGFAGEMWQTRRINVNTNHARCSDGKSNRAYRDTVTVTVDGRVYRGCGGGSAEKAPGPVSTVEGDWRIEAIGGRAVARGTSPEISFRGGRISGNAGCNRIGGSFDFARGRLRAGPLLTTRMACTNRAAAAQEAEILRILRQPVTVSGDRGGKLILAGPRGESLSLARTGRR